MSSIIAWYSVQSTGSRNGNSSNAMSIWHMPRRAVISQAIDSVASCSSVTSME